MIGTAEKRGISCKPEYQNAKGEHNNVKKHEVRSSREGAFLQIKEFDQDTRKRVKDRVY